MAVGIYAGATPEPQVTPISNARRPTPLTADQVKLTISHEIEDANGNMNTWLSETRRRAIDDYYGLPFGNEQPGRSQVVLTEVADTIEWMMTSLMRMFAGSPITGEYRARNQAQVQMAKDATKFVNAKFRDEMDGDLFLYNFIKDGLLEKRGFGVAFVEEFFEPKIETFKHQTRLDVELLLMRDPRGLEVIDFQEYVDNVPDPQTGQMIPMTFYDLKTQQTKSVRRVMVEGIAPEEFLIARRAIKLNDETPYCGRRVKRSISYLTSIGFDPVILMNIPGDDSPEFTLERVARHAEEGNLPFDTSDRMDAASRELWVTESFIRLDEDGDGFAELRRIITVGDQGSHNILEDVEANWNPFFSWCPIPTPHKFFGQSIADIVGDIQRMKSTLLRSIFDNLYLQNNSRFEVVEGMVNLDDLLQSRPGGLVRVKQQGMVTPLVTAPMGPMPMQLMAFLEDTRASRTGVTRYNQGIDASTLNDTATGVSAIMNAAAAKVELIARMVAPGIRQLYKNLLRLYIENGFQHESFEVDGRWLDVNPSTWSSDWNVIVHVGLGVGAAQQRIQHLMAIQMQQKEILNMPGGRQLVSMQNVYAATEDIRIAIEVEPEGRYFTNPANSQWPEPAPDVKMIESQRRSKEDQATATINASKIVQDEQKEAGMMKFRVLELEVKDEREKYRIDADKDIRMAQVKVDEERVEVDHHRVDVDEDRVEVEEERMERETSERSMTDVS